MRVNILFLCITNYIERVVLLLVLLMQLCNRRGQSVGEHHLTRYRGSPALQPRSLMQSEDIGAPPKSLADLHPDPLIRHHDLKGLKAKEVVVFMEENKIWQDLLADCIERSGVNASLACRELKEIVQERVAYYNSRFNPGLRPTKTPGLWPEFEGRPKPPQKK